MKLFGNKEKLIHKIKNGEIVSILEEKKAKQENIDYILIDQYYWLYNIICLIIQYYWLYYVIRLYDYMIIYYIYNTNKGLRCYVPLLLINIICNY